METKQIPTMQSVIDGFLADIASIRSNAIFTSLLIEAIESKTAQQFKNFFESNGFPLEHKDQSVALSPEQARKFRRLQIEFDRAQRGKHIVARGFTVSLVSQYDAFLSSLVRELFRLQPNLIQSSRKTIDISEILLCTSIEEVKDSVVDDEIESLLRESHVSQFAWLENKFNIQTLKKDLDVWPDFVELTQRRNLFVHTDGKISKQYLKICKEQGVKLPDNVGLGAQVTADRRYVRHGSDVLFEIAVKLSQVLWRKTCPTDLAAADQALNAIAYNLLEQRRYKLAIKVLDFAFETIKKYSSNEARLRFLINRANAYRLNGEHAQSLKLIASEDWSASSLPFKLAHSVISGDLEQAALHMRSIGPNGEITKDNYRNWPLFEGVRGKLNFDATFRDIFGEDISVPEIIKPTLKDFDLEDSKEAFLLELLDTEEVGLEIEATVSAHNDELTVVASQETVEGK